jgi:uncharacterized protein (PEP-CTERM system associated)
MVARLPKMLEGTTGHALFAGPLSRRYAVDPAPVRDGRRYQAPASWLGVALICGAIPAAHAENWRITPTLAVTETLTNNLYLNSTNRTSDLVTGITPGISIDGKGGRASLRLSYAFTEQIYARESSSNGHQNALTAIGTLEAIDDWLYIDATGSISQQYLSAFGAISPSNANVNRNQTETSSYSISPYIKGRFLTSTEYFLRYKGTTTSSQSGLAPDLNSSEWVGRVNGLTGWGPLSWALDASNVRSDYSRGQDYEATRYGLTLTYRINPQWRVSLIGGQESNNYVSLHQETHNTSGYGFVWTPGPRTELSATQNRRFFGDGYDVSFSHRMPLSMVTYRASRNVSFQPAGVGYTGQGSNFDAFYAIIAASNPGMAPDAVREQVTQVLQARGLPADGTVVNGYLNDRPNLQTLQQLSFALLGARNTVTLNMTESEQQPLGLANGVTNDYSLSNRTLQRGVGLIWGHQLTGLSTLSLSLTQQRSISYLENVPDSKTQGAYLLWSTRISPKTQANIGARRVIADGASSYTESALTGALSHSF